MGLTSLCERRIRGDMIQTFKIIKGIDDVDYKTWFKKVNECHQRTRLATSVSDNGDVVHSENLLEPKSRLDVRKNFFSCRVVQPWNNLPPGVQVAADVQDFKVKYDDFIGGN